MNNGPKKKFAFKQWAKSRYAEQEKIRTLIKKKKLVYYFDFKNRRDDMFVNLKANIGFNISTCML